MPAPSPPVGRGAQASYGIGMVTGSLALLGRGRGHPVRWLLLGAFAGAAGTATTGLAPVLALALAGQLLAGAGNAMIASRGVV